MLTKYLLPQSFKCQLEHLYMGRVSHKVLANWESVSWNFTKFKLEFKLNFVPFLFCIFEFLSCYINNYTNNLYSNRLKSISVIYIFCDMQFEILSLSQQLFNNKHVNLTIFIKKVIINIIDKDWNAALSYDCWRSNKNK